MKKTLLAIPLIFITLFASAKTEFDLLYFDNMEDFYGIEACADNGLLYYGTLDQDPTGRSMFGELAAFLIKRDESGLIEWSKVIGGEFDEQIISVEETASGEIILLGYQASDYEDDSLFVMKLNAQGEMIWEKKVGGYQTPDMNSQSGVDYLSLDKNGLIYFLTPTGNTRYEDYAIVSMDPANGNIIDSKVFRYTTTRADVKSLEVVSEGVVLTSGTINDSGKIRAFLLKYDMANDKVLFSKQYNIDDYYYVTKAVPTKDGGYAFTGNISSVSYSNIITVKLDESGDIEWANKIGDDDSRVNASTLLALDNGDIAISGLAQPQSGISALYSLIGSDGITKFSQKVDGYRSGKLSKSHDRIYLGNEMSYTEVNTAIADASGTIYTSNASFYFDLPSSTTSALSQDLAVSVADITLNSDVSDYYLGDYEAERAPLPSSSKLLTKIIEGVTLVGVNADKFYTFTGASRTEGTFTDLYFLQLDQYGTKTQENNTDMASISYDEGEEIIQLSQNNFLVRNNYEGHIAALVKYNADGSYNTGKLVHASNYATITGRSLQYMDGSIFYAGSHRPASGGRTNVIATKLDEDLNVTWSKSYGYPDVYFASEFIFGDSDGNMIINLDQSYPTLLKTNENGDILWCKRYDVYGKIREFYEIPGTGYFSVSDDFILKIDYDGNVISAKDFSQNRVYSSYFTKSSNGGYLCTFDQQVDGERKLSAIMFDADFNIFWHRYYNIDFYVRDVAENQNGDFIIVGRNDRADKGYIFMIDQFGNPSEECFNFETDITFTTPDITVSVSDVDIESYDEVATTKNITDTEHYLTTQDKTDLKFEYASSFKDISCFGQDNGSIEIAINGGIEPIKYKWSNGESSASLSGLAPGTYSVSVSDFIGCEYKEEFIIKEPEELTFKTASTDVTCFGGTDGTASAQVNGGTEPYSYFWSNGSRNDKNENLFAGEFFINVSDFKGCNTAPQKVIINEPAKLEASITLNGEILCFGKSTAEVEATPIGGTAPFTYLWSTGAKTAVLSGIPAGDYSVEITDACGVTESAEISIGQPAPLKVSHDFTDVSCFGENDGSISLTVSTGQNSYDINWSDHSASQSIKGLFAGDYTYTVEDGCQTISKTVTISQPDALTLDITGSDISCNGAADGSANAVVTGGTKPYAYNWSNGLKTAKVENLFGGTYNLQVVDLNGCHIFNSVSITEPEKLTAQIEAGNNSCFGVSEGHINITLEGGVAPYAYVWSNQETTQDLTDVPSGNYEVTITDVCGESVVKSATISEPGDIDLTIEKTDITCFGDHNGSVSVGATGGSLPYTYDWSTGDNTSFINNLDADTITVTVSDQCDNKKTAEVIINEPALLTAEVTTTDITCFGNLDGTAEVSVTGGTLPYNYIWNNGQTSATITGLFQGKHTVNIVDANGCNASNSGTITQPGKLTASVTVENNECYGTAEGSVNVTLEGGVADYSFLWSNQATTQSLTDVQAGSYNVTITDGCGEQLVRSATVTQPEDIALTIEKTDITCFGENDGSVSLSTTGGNLPYTYDWSTGDNTSFIENLGADTITVTVSDQCANEKTAEVIIIEPGLLSVDVTTEDITCYGNLDGTAEATVIGGTEPYNYIWNNGQTSKLAVGLFQGKHTVNIVDANGCNASNSGNITQPEQLAVSFAVTNNDCHGGGEGSITATIESGLLPVTYEWSTGSTEAEIINLPADMYTVTVTDACGDIQVQSVEVSQINPVEISVDAENISCNGKGNGSIEIITQGGADPHTFEWSNGAETNLVTGLSADIYTVIITDNCNSKFYDTIQITEPEPLEIAVDATDIECYGMLSGTATATANGGTEPYNYIWNNGQRKQTAINLFPGLHTINVLDGNGCSAANSVTISQPLPMKITTATEDVTCFGQSTGSATITVTDGAEPYSYVWSIGEVTSEVTNLTAGTYLVTITDACGESQTESLLIQEPSKLSVEQKVQDIKCFGQTNGEIIIEPYNGSTPYTITWSNGSKSFVLTDLEAETLSYTVQDQCGDEISETIKIVQPEMFDIEVITTDATCFGEGNGTASIETTGGVAPFIYNWSIGLQNTELQGLYPGEYSVNVFDANGCLASENFIISEPLALSVETSVIDAECGISNGAITATVEGGVAPYTYNWSDGSTSASLANATQGDYTVSVTDAAGCSISAETEVSVYAPVIPICMLTVDRFNGKNKVVWQQAQSSSVTNVNIYRMVGGVYQSMGTVDSSEYSYYDDMLSNPRVTAARYAITAEDACGNESDFSPFHQTIHLGAAKGNDGTSVILDWTEYKDESGEFTPQWYYLYRGTAEGELQLFDSVDAKVATEYNDIDPQGAIYYQVAVNKESCDPTSRLKSDSGPFSQSMSNLAESIIVTNINSADDIASIIYPNPSNGVFTLQVDDFSGFEVEITNMAGQIVWQGELISTRTKVNILKEPIGIYSVTLKRDNTSVSKTVIKEK